MEADSYSVQPRVRIPPNPPFYERPLIMNTQYVEDAVKRLCQLDAALKWLRANGESAFNMANNGYRVDFAFYHGSRLDGCKEAEIQLSGCVKVLGLQILETAIKDAENTIEVIKQGIIKELSAPDTAG